MKLPKSHPRYLSLLQRHRIEDGVRKGITHPQGLIAQGRGEAFDYLLREKTNAPAKKAIRAAAALLLLAKSPVLSVNGNIAALCPKEMVSLADAIPAKLEVNLFYRTGKRAQLIARELKKNGAKKVYGVSRLVKLHGLESKRGLVDPEGMAKADVVLVPLEDGDRTEALVRAKKKVIAIDLNPLSRTSKKASITIVDNAVRCIQLLIREVKSLKKISRAKLVSLSKFNNKRNLRMSLSEMRLG